MSEVSLRELKTPANETYLNEIPNVTALQITLPHETYKRLLNAFELDKKFVTKNENAAFPTWLIECLLDWAETVEADAKASGAFDESPAS